MEMDKETLKELAPKDGVKTSSFRVLIATIVFGGLFTWLTRRGVSQEFLETHRGELIALISQALPYAYFGLIGFLGRVFMRYRERISLAKAQAYGEAIRGKPRLTYRELALRVRDEDVILPVLAKIQTSGEIQAPEIVALMRLGQEVGNNRRDIAVVLLALAEAGIMELSPEEANALHKTNA